MQLQYLVWDFAIQGNEKALSNILMGSTMTFYNCSLQLESCPRKYSWFLGVMPFPEVRYRWRD